MMIYILDIYSNMMYSPYIDTVLYTTVLLPPNMLDNKIYLNLKNNLENKILNKCYKNYGFVNDIYEILKYNDGVIEAENLAGSVLFDVSFSCRLCMPLIRKKIICQVERVNKILITAKNGPVLVIITNERINDKIFFIDNNNSIRYRKDGASHILKPTEFVKLEIQSRTFDDGGDKIKTIGYLDDMASEDEIKEYYTQLHHKGEQVKFDEYMKDEE